MIDERPTIRKTADGYEYTTQFVLIKFDSAEEAMGWLIEQNRCQQFTDGLGTLRLGAFVVVFFLLVLSTTLMYMLNMPMIGSILLGFLGYTIWRFYK